MTVNLDRVRTHLDRLAVFTRSPGNGCTRLSYTPEFRASCDYVAERAEALGLGVRIDAVGNLRARLEGRDPDAACVMVASHLDTVINGGNFDGVLGVVCGLEVIESLVESGRRPRRPVELVAFAEEEGTTYRCPLAGSKALTGALGPEDLKSLRDVEGRSWYDTLVTYGAQPDELERQRLKPGDLHAMLELHIEQGAILEAERLPIGIVEQIAGSENYRITLTGRANHAGTTPMHLRSDALAAAAEVILAVETFATDPARPDTVATVGRIRCLPNAANVIAEEVEISLDVRDIDPVRLQEAASALKWEVAAIATRRSIGCNMELTGRSDPRPLSQEVVGLLDRLAGEAGLPHRRMASGALHDAAMLTDVTRVGMIFVPSREGLSHTPREWTEAEDIRAGTLLLLAAVTSLADG